MVCVARGPLPVERNLYALFFFCKKERETKPHTYTDMFIFVQRNTGKLNWNLMKIVNFLPKIVK